MRKLLAALLALLLCAACAEEAEWVSFEPSSARERGVTEWYADEASRAEFCEAILSDADLKLTDITLGMLTGEQGLVLIGNLDGALTDVLYYQVTGSASYWITDHAYRAETAAALTESACESAFSISYYSAPTT